ncbi:MAG: hypothetical protein N3G80_03535 [Candidatus Micrarchaeota archaeon]|nr:hypothetical protein [Candidatus Micrarchaeota archaeon]
MKFKMSPARAYLLGLWKSRKTAEGVGIEGSAPVAEAFVKVCLDEKLAEPNKIQYVEEKEKLKCFFYNSALRSWLQEEVAKREERLKYRNEFAASYFAGVLDAKGGIMPKDEQKICFFVGDKVDEIVLLRLGFRVKREEGKIVVLSPDFYGWVAPYLKVI